MRPNGRPIDSVIAKLQRRIARLYRNANKAYKSKHNIIAVRHLNLAEKLEQKLKLTELAKEYGAERSR